MKIANFNIDWARKSKSKNHYRKIESFLNEKTFDFLVITEGIHLDLPQYEFLYHSEKLPENQVYEGLNYTEFLNGENAYRSLIYSKFPAKKIHKVIDPKTSLAVEFSTAFGEIIIFSTIIGTWFNRKPYVQKELNNCISDCNNLSKENPNLFIVGDFNTSFLETEKKFTINKEITNSLVQLFDELNLMNSTKEIKENIDHIVLPKSFESSIHKSEIFVEKNILSDHQGIMIELIKNI